MCASMEDKDSKDISCSTVNVFVTGQPGIGKTTLVRTVASKLPQDVIAGFYTVEARAPGSGERLGLDVVTFSGERTPLCRLRRGCGPKIGKYYVAIEDFERVVIPQLTPSKEIKLHIIDEIGRLELVSEKFKETVTKLLDSSRAVFGSLPAPRYGHTLEEVEQIKQRPDTAVLTLTKANRATTAQEITELLGRLVREAQEEEEEAEEVENALGCEGNEVHVGGTNGNSVLSGGGENSHETATNGGSSADTSTQQHLDAALAQVANAVLPE